MYKLPCSFHSFSLYLLFIRYYAPLLPSLFLTSKTKLRIVPTFQIIAIEITKISVGTAQRVYEALILTLMQRR